MEEQHYQLLDGKAVSAQMKKEMAEEVAQIKAAGGKIPVFLHFIFLYV